MRNPWLALPETGPLVLSFDRAQVEAFNATAAQKYKYDLSLFPEPFFGSRDAPVVVLNLNPGWSPGDAAVHASPEFAAMSRASLRHDLAPYPFLHLQPNNNTPGGAWWQRRAQELIADVGFDQVARFLGCVQLVAYHSAEYSPATPTLASQAYSFWLVREAMARQAEIVVMRAVRLWMAAVPELSRYDRLHVGANPRATYLSRGNLKASYAVVARRLRSDV
jgi:hypothetical protein